MRNHGDQQQNVEMIKTPPADPSRFNHGGVPWLPGHTGAQQARNHQVDDQVRYGGALLGGANGSRY